MHACYDVCDGFEDDSHRPDDGWQGWGDVKLGVSLKPSQPGQNDQNGAPALSDQAPFVGGRLDRAHVPLPALASFCCCGTERASGIGT